MDAKEIGLVLYTVRDRAEKDFARTLREVAAIGYRRGELCGTFGMGAAALKELGDEISLGFPSAHVGLGDLAEKFDETVDYYAGVGVTTLVIPGLPGDRTESVEAWRRTARELSGLGARLKERGITLLYHNHAAELEPMGGTSGWDILVAEADPESLGFEVDVYWGAYGGRDPMAMLRAVAGRVPYVHAKDMAPGRTMTEVGRGTLDFPAFVAAKRELGVECFFVEHDDPAPPTIASARVSFEYLRSL